jgi:hypothetical protein
MPSDGHETALEADLLEVGRQKRDRLKATRVVALADEGNILKTGMAREQFNERTLACRNTFGESAST